MNGRRAETMRWSFAGGKLLGTLSWQDEPGPSAIVYVHGFGSSHDGHKGLAIERACARQGWTCAAFDFRGHGHSSGDLFDLSGSRLQEDLRQIRACLEERGVTTLFLVGSSMGAWASAWFALEHPDVVPACVGIAPAFAFLEGRWNSLSDEQRLAWQQTGRHHLHNEWLDVELGYSLMQERDTFAFPALVQRWATPLLIFHGLRDQTVPWHHSLTLLQQCPGQQVELRLYKDGDHRLLARAEEMAEASCSFLARWRNG
jgi:pimeloyl-ACP methyl ester carboxylesterase